MKQMRQAKVRWFDLGIHVEQVAAFIEEATDVIVVDALKASPVGEITVMNLRPMLDSHSAQLRQCHGMSWVDEIALVKSNATITFVGINVSDDGWGEGLSVQAQTALPKVVRRLVELCELRESNSRA
jgi:hydrogenase maturation protease